MYKFIKKEKFRLTWRRLYYALKNNLLSYSKIWDYYLDILEIEKDNMNISDKIVLYENDKEAFLKYLEDNFDLSEENDFWEFISLYQIYKDEEMILSEKLKKIEYIWANYGYSEELKDFIYYMPNGKTDSEEGIYMLFEQYIINKRSKFIIK